MFATTGATATAGADRDVRKKARTAIRVAANRFYDEINILPAVITSDSLSVTAALPAGKFVGP